MSEMTMTASEQYSIFQAEDGWHYQPNQAINPFEGGADYSPAYSTRAEALDAAEEWEETVAREATEEWRESFGGSSSDRGMR
jgi:hypothetical protein